MDCGKFKIKNVFHFDLPVVVVWIASQCNLINANFLVFDLSSLRLELCSTTRPQYLYTAPWTDLLVRAV